MLPIQCAHVSRARPHCDTDAEVPCRSCAIGPDTVAHALLACRDIMLHETYLVLRCTQGR